MLTLFFLVKTFIDLYIMMLILRIWMQWTVCDTYNPFFQLIIKITQPVIIMLSKFIYIKFSLNYITLFLAFILAVIKFPILTFLDMKVLVFNPIYILFGILSLIKTAGKLLFWIVIIRSLRNWMHHNNTPMDIIFYQLSEIIMYPIRHILQNKNNIDFSSIIITMILYLLNYIGMDVFPNIWNKL